MMPISVADLPQNVRFTEFGREREGRAIDWMFRPSPCDSTTLIRVVCREGTYRVPQSDVTPLNP